MMTKMILMFSTWIKIIFMIAQLFFRKIKISSMKLKDQMKWKLPNKQSYNQVIKLSKFLQLINNLKIHKVNLIKGDGVKMSTADF
jgi:hypothetical protein